MHEGTHHTRVVRVAEPNLIVSIIVIQSKLGKWELRNPALGHEAVNDECSPHLLHLHTVRIVWMFPAARPLARVLYSCVVRRASCCILQFDNVVMMIKNSDASCA